MYFFNIKDMMKNILCLLLILFCASCGIIPIQMVRVTQTESYVQTFTALKIDKINVDTEIYPAMRDQNEIIDIAFNNLLGTKNWQNIKDLYGLKDIRDELLSEKVYVKGLFSFSISINPLDHKEFYFEGNGRYFIIRDKTGEIMLTGDFIIPLQTNLISDIELGYIIAGIELYTTRVPKQATYHEQIGLFYKIYLDTSLNKHKIFSLDYNKIHEVYLADNPQNKHLSKKDLIGELKLQGINGAKYIDLRGMKLLRKDYKKKKEKSSVF